MRTVIRVGSVPFIAIALVAACDPAPSETAEPESQAQETEAAEATELVDAETVETRPLEAVSFAGEPLYRFDIPAKKIETVTAQIADLEAKESLTEDDYINFGYLNIEIGQFNGAIDVYTKGLEAFPDSFKLLRHRGHRYINTRQLDKAIVDLERAVELIGDEHTNAIQYRLSGDPFGTYEHWVWYHIALYHYLNGDYAQAASAYEKCVTTAAADTMLVGATDWLYNAYMKNGEPEKAEAALAYVPDDIDVNPGYSYWQRVQVYKGLATPDEFLDLEKPGTEWDGREITSGYGLANWYKWNGDEAAAQLIYDNILDTPFWSSWAYVVTDREQSEAE